MRIHEIYREFNIMPSLQLHMLRVAGVAEIVTEQYNNPPHPIDTTDILVACALHDLGNIAKFDLRRFPQFLEPQGLEYWEKVKVETITKYEKYGKSPSDLTRYMCEIIGVSDRVLTLIKAINFSEARKNYVSTDFSKKICAYSDMRVAPTGVTSLRARLDDARERYRIPGKSDDSHNSMRLFIEEIGVQLASVVSVALDDITEESVRERFESLKMFEVPVSEKVATRL